MAFNEKTSIMPKLNKPAKEGLQYRSPDQTNAKSALPHPKEDVIKSQKADNERIRKGLSAPGKTERGRLMQQEAGGRAMTRTGGRAGAAGAALMGGYELGRAIDEKTGLGKKMVDKSGLGDLAERAVNRRDKVELSDESKARIAKGDLEAKPAKEDSEAATPAPAPTNTPRKRSMGASMSEPTGKMNEGENENIDSDTRARAMASVSGMKKGGMTKSKKYASGGSVSNASSRADGIAQRGKTRCKIC
jgi:hypothetical protein